MSNDATSGNKDDGIIDDWEQLDQQVSPTKAFLLSLSYYSYLFVIKTIQKSLQTIKLNSQLNSSQNEEKIFSK